MITKTLNIGDLSYQQKDILMFLSYHRHHGHNYCYVFNLSASIISIRWADDINNKHWNLIENKMYLIES